MCLKELLNDLQQRKVIFNQANLNNFLKLKISERTIYWGVDCTSSSLHIGHLFQIIQLFRLVRENFKIFFLLGGATSKLGDPSDKVEERKKLEADTLNSNLLSVKNQLLKILYRWENFNFGYLSPLEIFFSKQPELLLEIYQVLDICITDSRESKWNSFCRLLGFFPEDKDSFFILNNSVWLEQISCVDFFNLLRRGGISVNYLLAKDWVKKRLETGLSYSAFSYSLLQAYDFYYLYSNYGCFGQLGGSDQWGNITTGLKLIRSFVPESRPFAFSLVLLTDKKKEKISKTKISKSFLLIPEEFYDFFRNMSDEQTWDYLMKFTVLSEQQVKRIISLNKPPSLRIGQRLLLELLWFLNFGDMSNLQTIHLLKT